MCALWTVPTITHYTVDLGLFQLTTLRHMANKDVHKTDVDVLTEYEYFPYIFNWLSH